jgi:flagellar biosynthesis/type III secretory pathway protein FliH
VARFKLDNSTEVELRSVEAELTYAQRAYLQGVRDGFGFGKEKARLEAEQLINEFKKSITEEVHARLEAMRIAYERLHAIDRAADIERDPATRLN